ncbi:MAG: hypothetical protein NVV60_01410 [Luteimonas sp.]|nr:hypothetical protein [Luteimonas sp.]
MDDRKILLLDIGAPAGDLPVETAVPQIYGSWFPTPHQAETIPAPDDVTTDPVADGILIEWAAVPGAEIYIIERGPSNTGPWTEVARTTDTRYLYSDGSGESWYFKITPSVRGRVGAGTVTEEETPRQTPDMDELVALQTEIDTERSERIAEDLAGLATAAADATAKANAALATANANLAVVGAQVDALGAQIGDIVDADVWNSATTYPAGDHVQYAGKLYRALVANTNKRPDLNPGDWELLGNYTSLGEAVAASLSMGTQNTSAIEAEASRIDAVRASLGGRAVNLLAAEWNRLTAPAVALGAATTPRLSYTRAADFSAREVVANADALFGHEYRFVVTDTAIDNRVYFGAPTNGYNTIVKPGRYIVSFWARASVAGHLVRPLLRESAPDAQRYGADIALTTTRQRYSTIVNVVSTNGPVICGFQPNRSGVAGREIHVDGWMVEEAIGDDSTTPSTFAPGGIIAERYATSAVVSSIDSRVTAAEGVISSHGTAITAVTNAVNHPTTGLATRAAQSTVATLDGRVTAAEGVISSQGTAITAVTNTVNHPSTGLATRAAQSTVNTLDGRVTAAEGVISSQGSAITAVSNSLSSTQDALPLGAADNIIITPTFESGRRTPWNGGTIVATATHASRTAALEITGSTYYSPTSTYIPVAEGDTFDVSYDVDMSGASAGSIYPNCQWIDKSGNNIGTMGAGGATANAGTGWQTRARTSPAVAPAGAAFVRPGFTVSGITGVARITNINWYRRRPAEVASSVALSALDSRVSSAEGTITSQGAAITSVTNTVNHPTTGLASRASQTALNSLSGTVTVQGNAIAAHSSDLSSIGVTLGNHNASLIQMAEVQASGIDSVTIFDPSFELMTGWGNAAGAATLPANVIYSTVSPPPGSTRSLRFNYTTATAVAYNRGFSRCIGGQTYRFRWKTRGAANPAGNIRFYVVWYNEAQSELGSQHIWTMAGANHDWTERTALWTVPDGAAYYKVAVGVQGGSSPGVAHFDDVSGELLGSDVVTLRARRSVLLNVDGNVSGTISENDGETSSFSILGTIFRVLGFGAAGMEWQDGYLRIWKGTAQLVIGSSFGASSDLVLWYGQNIGATGCTKANAKIWFDTTGDAYFGGTLSAGVLRNAAQTSVIGTTAQVEIGAFGTNGNSKVVTYSMQYQNGGLLPTDPGSSALTATVVLERSYNGGAWTQVSTMTASGNRTSNYDSESSQYFVTMGLSGSSTFTDSLAGTQSFNYRVRITAHTGGWPMTIGGQLGMQRLTVLSTEEP